MSPILTASTISLRRAAALVACAGLLIPSGAFGQRPAPAVSNVVTFCGPDDIRVRSDGRLTFPVAIENGGNIEIRCSPSENVVTLTRTYILSGAVSIDGGGATLRGEGDRPLLQASGNVRLSNLTLTNPRPRGSGTASIVQGETASVTLDGVRTEASPSAYIVRSLSARESVFIRNGVTTTPDPYGAIIDAESVALTDCQFLDNDDHPIAGGAAPPRAPMSRRIAIEGSLFQNNRASVLISDAQATIRDTRFVNNGIRSQPGGKAHWGCCGGAITLVHSSVDIRQSRFVGNASSGFGGAIYALGTSLTVRDSVFERNAARVGGAIMSWARAPAENIWSGGPSVAAPALFLSATQFNENKATALGGALAFSGGVEGSSALFRANQAGRAGGAIASWKSAPLPPPYDVVFGALDGASQGGVDSLVLANPILVDNIVDGSGAAIASGDATVRLGNALVARNESKINGGALAGGSMTLVNSTIADNRGIGLAAGARLGNVIFLSNRGGNCASVVSLAKIGPNLQHPGNACGAVAEARDPALDSAYAPGVLSIARNSGDYGLCVSDPLVFGIDLLGEDRTDSKGRCSIGAIEQDTPEAIASALTFGRARDNFPLARAVLWLIAVLALLVLMLSALKARKKRRR